MTTARVHRLANGLTIAVEPMDGVETLAVGVYADVGSRSEAAGQGGLAHLVEHMVFKGAGGRDARAIAEDIEDVGGSLNAWTARDHTVYHARLLAGDLALGVDMIADLVRAPRFDPDELEREKKVVLSELGEANDTPDDIVFDHLQSACYPGQAIGVPVLGDERTLATLTAGDLRRWTEAQYRPGSLVLAAAGKVDEDALLALAEARFGDMAAGTAPAAVSATFGGGTHHDRRKFDQIHLAAAWAGVGHEDPDVHALSLFSSAAGGGMSSRLFQQLREERGLAYSIYSWTQTYAETGLFGLYCAAERPRAAEALALARVVLAQTADDLSEAELARAKSQAKAGWLMGLESVAARCDRLARDLQVHGRIVPVAETVAAIDAVTVAHARAAGAKALGGAEALATVGGTLTGSGKAAA
ncbi:M16 family metallopeptidase [Sphingomonas arantia]|uniref:M16 family metallopeptidase n=1 Tax=Sphingomonas arantia TaxID=1460676 RepID=A0ABW4TSN0_9SPHN